MDTGLDKAKLLHYKALAVKLLGNPLKLRLAVVLGTLSAGLLLAYMPLSDQIDQRRLSLHAEAHRTDSIKDVEGLRKQVEAYRGRISQKSDTNEWVQYILGGVRESQVRLRDMESKEPVRVGPYKAVVLNVEIEGSYARCKQFLEWLETSERLLRVDAARFERRADQVTVRMTLLGLVGTDASPTQ